MELAGTIAAGMTPLGWASAGLSVFSTLSGIGEAKEQGRAERAALERNAQIAEVRAENLRREALSEEASSQREAVEARRQSRLRRSAALASGAASGGYGYEGTLAAIDEVGAFNELSALFEGKKVAAGLRSEAEGSMFEAGVQRYEQGLSKQREKRKVTSTLLSGGTSLADSLSEAYSAGTPARRTLSSAHANAPLLR